jgi:V/A-type H+-transporting ATPase subunit A
MPVAAREASIYTGITIAEYYRDMGYHVALIADSTSRWAEALREISGRLEEMPAEEGFPAYLPSRIAQFYERAGYVDTLSGNEGSVTVIGAVSPQGADFSEPVTQNTKRFVRSFWALDKSLAYARHFPAINWNQSYSEYLDDLKRWYDVNVDRKFLTLRNEMMNILHEETQLMEIVKLIGSDVLPEDQKLSLEIARVIRVGYLQQNAFHPEDTFVPFEKQLKMLQLISYTKAQASRVVSTHRTVRAIVETGIFEDLIKIKYEIPNNNLDALDTYYEMIDLAMASIQ